MPPPSHAADETQILVGTSTEPFIAASIVLGHERRRGQLGHLQGSTDATAPVDKTQLVNVAAFQRAKLPGEDFRLDLLALRGVDVRC